MRPALQQLADNITMIQFSGGPTLYFKRVLCKRMSLLERIENDYFKLGSS